MEARGLVVSLLSQERKIEGQRCDSGKKSVRETALHWRLQRAGIS